MGEPGEIAPFLYKANRQLGLGPKKLAGDKGRSEGEGYGYGLMVKA